MELGGPDYAKNAPKVQDSQGFEIQGATGKGSGYRWAVLILPLANLHSMLSKRATGSTAIP